MNCTTKLTGTVLNKLCRVCKNNILWGSSYQRYYCSKECYDSTFSVKKCARCRVDFKSNTPTLLCDDCSSKIYVGVDINHELFQTYSAMIQRCYNPNRNNYRHYGKKGIEVCSRWLESFHNFLHDMGNRPDGMTLDRINNSIGYSPDNCRWVSIEEQRINRGRFRNAKGKYKGVLKHGNKFVSNIRHKTKSIYLGSFDTEIEAAEAYNDKVKEFYPETWRMYVNVIKEIGDSNED